MMKETCVKGYGFQIETSPLSGKSFLGLYRGEREVFALELPQELTAESAESLADGLAFLARQSYEEGLRKMYELVQRVCEAAMAG